MKLALQQAMTCFVCERNLDHEKRRNTLIEARLFGARPFAVCPCCGQRPTNDTASYRRRARSRIHRLVRMGCSRIDQEAKGATSMTIWDAYRCAARLAQSHLVADARAAAIDSATARRARLSTPSVDWRSCGPRAARVTMDRGFAAAVARIEARDRMLFDPFAAEEERKITAIFAKRRAARLQ
jgi:hypothetical protein